ncbi:MAG: hypothetical protein WA208_15580 [Thermoanaerobaculia bacterium]
MLVLYIAGAVVLPIVVVAALLGFDRLMELGQRHRRIVWPILIVSQLFEAIASAIERGFDWMVGLHALAIVAIVAAWLYENAKGRGEDSGDPASDAISR